MTYLIVAGIIAVLAGIYMLIAPIFFKNFCGVVDKIVFILDEQVQKIKLIVGFLLLAVAGWVFYLSLNPEIGRLLHPVWVIALVFGLLYLFFPKWLESLSKIANKSIFPTDQYVLGSAKVIGLLLLLSAAYIFYMVYVISLI